jgi:hypothetical protein
MGRTEVLVRWQRDLGTGMLTVYRVGMNTFGRNLIVQKRSLPEGMLSSGNVFNQTKLH